MKKMLIVIAMAVLSALNTVHAQEAPIDPATDIRGLPLIEVRAPAPTSEQFAIFLTGDGGWASLDRAVVKELGAGGISAVVLNMRDYLWHRRTPDQSGADLSRIIRHYEKAWTKQKVVVIGYSRGADIAPFMVSRLPGELRSDVVLVAMLGLATSTNFQFHFRDLIADTQRPGDLPVLPEVEHLRGMNLICIYGLDEKDSGCRSAPQGLMTIVERSGGHHFDNDFPALARIIETAIP
jgi:type IV secretory pathway VirJ component